MPRKNKITARQPCSHCGTLFTSRKNKIPIYCCDACAVKFIDEGMTLSELRKKGVFYGRALNLGWNQFMKFMECPVCHKRQRVDNPHRHAWKTYENDGSPACKTVVCTPMNAFRDQLLEAYPGLITVEEFNETRKIVMQVACKHHVVPSCMATAIFYLTAFRLDKKMPYQRDITRVVGVSDVTIRVYLDNYGYLFGFNRKEKVN